MKKLLALVGGIAAGFVAGILTAPKSGKETREELKNKASELKQEAEKRTTQAKSVAKDSAESIKTGDRKIGDTAVETAKEVKDSAEKRFK